MRRIPARLWPRAARTVRSGLLVLGMAGFVAVRAAAAGGVPASPAEGPFLYVANQEAAAVTVIDLEKGERVAGSGGT